MPAFAGMTTFKQAPFGSGPDSTDFAVDGGGEMVAPILPIFD
jgi:hypothetical protein